MNQRIDGGFNPERRARHREVRPRRDEPEATGQWATRALQLASERERQSATGAVAADGDVAFRNAMPAQPPPHGQSIVIGGGKGMFGREPVTNGEGPRARVATGLGDHAPMAQDRAGAIASTVEEQQRARLVRARDDRPLAGDAIAVDRFERHILGDRPDCADLVQSLATGRPSDGTRPGGQQDADGVDLVGRHDRASPQPAAQRMETNPGARLSQARSPRCGKEFRCDRIVTASNSTRRREQMRGSPAARPFLPSPFPPGPTSASGMTAVPMVFAA